MGVGYDRLDRVALAKRGVTVCNVPGSKSFGPPCSSIGIPNVSNLAKHSTHSETLSLQTMVRPRLPTTHWALHSHSDGGFCFTRTGNASPTSTRGCTLTRRW